MPYPIQIKIGEESVSAELNDSQTAVEIISNLPLKSEFSTWGDEIYFPVPITMKLENGKEVVDKGDIGYWPPGKALCIFYGTTPASTESEIRPASAVTLIGKVTGDTEIFKKLVQQSNTIEVMKGKNQVKPDSVY